MYDLIIKNGTIIDGSGTKAFKANVAVKDGCIASICADGEAKQTINALGKIVAPGFIDIHRHCDAVVFKPEFGEIELRQGITTIINGNCGLSIAPSPPKHRKEIMQYLRPIMGSLPKEVEFDSFSEYLNTVESQRLPLNFASHVGNGTLRMAAKGFETSALKENDYALIHHYLNDALNAGAFGVSMGLIYVPEYLYDFAALSKALAPIKGKNIPLVTHIRGEGDLLIQSLEEVINIAKHLEVPLHISHFKCVGKQNWKHLLSKAIELLEVEKSKGLNISFDVYPWEAGSTQLVQVLPPEYLEGGLVQTKQRLQNPKLRQNCKKIMETSQTAYENLISLVGWENIMISAVQSAKNQKYVGMRVNEIAESVGVDPYTCAFDLLVEEDCNVSIVNFIACEEDIKTILQHRDSYIISDSIYTDSGRPHPRQYGTFPKILQEYVRERKLLSLEQAIHKFTGAPAKGMGIKGKGLLHKGFDADITIFDPNTVKNNADYVQPMCMATGFSHVFVNGVLANDHDSFINSGAGKVLRKK